MDQGPDDGGNGRSGIMAHLVTKVTLANDRQI